MCSWISENGPNTLTYLLFFVVVLKMKSSTTQSSKAAMREDYAEAQRLLQQIQHMQQQQSPPASAAPHPLPIQPHTPPPTLAPAPSAAYPPTPPQPIQKALSADLQALVTSGNLTEEQAHAMMPPAPLADTPTPAAPTANTTAVAASAEEQVIALGRRHSLLGLNQGISHVQHHRHPPCRRFLRIFRHWWRQET